MDLNFKRWFYFSSYIGLALLCIACSGQNSFAPVFNGLHGHRDQSGFLAHRGPYAVRGIYKVQRGDTLFSIAFRHNMDYRDLAKLNHIAAPYHILVGQKLRVRDEDQYDSSANGNRQPGRVQQSQVNIKSKKSQDYSSSEQNDNTTVIHTPTLTHGNGRWLWPTQGNIIARYSPASGNKGINISNRAGTPIFATAGGIVVYQGDGLEGYGKLIIIKHNDLYLSAYAHNAQVFVHEGQKVAQGEKIATMGATGSNRVMLHFEIRKAGKPVDPMGVLSAQ